jgi:hypothetical protein
VSPAFLAAALLAAVTAVGLPGVPETVGAEPSELLARIAKRQAELDHYDLELEIRVLDGSGDAAGLTLPARVLRRGPVTLQEFQNFIFLMHPDMRVAVDRAARTIHLNPARAETAPIAEMDPGAALSKLREAGYELQADETPGRITLRFSADSRPTYVLAFDAANLRLLQMDAEGSSGLGGASAHTTVTYAWHEAGTSIPERLEPGFYVTATSKGWQPAPAFDGYRIVVSRAR